MKNKIAPLMILAYLHVPMIHDEGLLKYYPDIHKYCNIHVTLVRMSRFDGLSAL